MKKVLRFAVTTTALVLFGIGSATARADCETDEVITIANMTWSSAATLAHIEARILQAGYDCQTQLVPGDTVPTATTMASKGQPHIAPEFWMANAEEIVRKGVESGMIDIAGEVVQGGSTQGWWIPKYLSEAYPDLKSVHDLPRYKHLFPDASDPEKGRIYNCPPGWGCEIVNTNLFKAYGLGSSYVNYSPGSGAALDATIASAYKRKKPWLGYYWGPSSILGKYDMVRLETNPHDPVLDACNREAECQNPHAGGFNSSQVNTLVTSTLKDGAPSVYTFLSKVSFDPAVYNELLAWGDDNKAEPAEVADHFLKHYPHLWQGWVSDEAAEKLKANLL